MRARNHVIVSAGVSLGFQAMVHSWPASAACFIGGVLIDLDHCFDYYIFKKKIPFKYKDLLDFFLNGKETKLYLFLHSYEFLFILWYLIYSFQLGNAWIGVALGLTIHLVCDQFTNPIKPLFYFLIFRIRNNFEKHRILSERYFQGNKNAV